MPSQKAIAEHLDLSQPEVSGFLAESGINWRTTDLAAIRVAYIRKLRAAAAGHRSTDGGDLIAERVMTERVDRELKELQLAEKKGQLVNLAQLEPELVQMVASFRTELLARDDKLKADLDALYAIDVDLQVLNDHTHESLTQLARYDPERAGIGAPACSADGAPGEDDDDGLVEAVQTSVGKVDGQAGAIQP